MRFAPCVNRFPTWARAAALSIPMATSLVACGGGDSPADPLARYKTQTLQWKECNSSAWQVVANLQCVDFVAPLDYATPDKGDITIAAMRVPAMSDQRKGAIFFNPGGPGANGLENGLGLLSAILQQQGASPQVTSLQAQLLNSYDLLGFTPRGTGQINPMRCDPVSQLVTDETSAGLNRPGNQAALNANARAEAQSCQASPLTPHISSDATARDMDLLRSLMGDRKISYIGYSYGTWLGAWYGRLFPERVDRMVLDSVADVSDAHIDFNEYQPIARDTLLNGLIAPYAARHAAIYGLGNTPQDVRAGLAALAPELKFAIARQTGGWMYSNENTGQILTTLAAAQGLQQLLDQKLAVTEERIEAHTYGPYDTPANRTTIRETAQKLSKTVDDVQSQTMNIGAPDPTGVTLGPTGGGINTAVFLAIMCNDYAFPSQDPADWHALNNRIAEEAPFFGGGALPTQACMYWPLPPVPQPPLSALQSLGNVLMVQSQYDIATPTPGAMKGFAALPKARMVYVTDEYNHGVFPYNTDCVDEPVLRHLLGQSPSARQTDCPASGVATPLDRIASKSEASPASQERARLIQEFKQMTGRGAGL